MIRDALSAPGPPVVPAPSTTTRCCRGARPGAARPPGAGLARVVGGRAGRRHGQDRVVPYFVPMPGCGAPCRCGAGRGPRPRRAVLLRHDDAGRPRQLGSDRAAVDAALTAADLVIDGERLAYALCRPPGHHATRSGTAGRATSTTPRSPRRVTRRRCGPGRDPGHRRPSRQWHPGDVLRASRRLVRLGARRPGGGLVSALRRVRGRAGERAGARANRNRPLVPGAGDDAWLAAMGVLCDQVREPDQTRWSCRWAWTRPPATRRARCASPRTATARRAAGSAPLGPAVFIQEGGYDLASLGLKSLKAAC